MQIDRHTDKLTHSHVHRQTDRQTHTHTHRQIGRQTTNTQTDDKHAGRQTDRQTDTHRQADAHVHNADATRLLCLSISNDDFYAIWQRDENKIAKQLPTEFATVAEGVLILTECCATLTHVHLLCVCVCVNE